MSPSKHNSTATDPEVDPEILTALHALLELTARTLVDAYPFPDDLLIQRGQYTAANAFSSTLIAQVALMQETLKHYEGCLEAARRAPPQAPEEPAAEQLIPF